MSRSKETRNKERERRDAWKKRRNSQPLSPIPATSPNPFGDGRPVQYVTPEELGVDKLSVCVLDLIDPFSNDANTEKSFSLLVNMGVAAWNIATLPEDKHKEMLVDILGRLFPGIGAVLSKVDPETDISSLRSMVQSVDPNEGEAFAVTISMMIALIERKLEMFPGDRRFIVKHWLDDSSGEPILRVASAVPRNMVKPKATSTD